MFNIIINEWVYHAWYVWMHAFDYTAEPRITLLILGPTSHTQDIYPPRATPAHTCDTDNSAWCTQNYCTKYVIRLVTIGSRQSTNSAVQQPNHQRFNHQHTKLTSSFIPIHKSKIRLYATIQEICLRHHTLVPLSQSCIAATMIVGLPFVRPPWAYLSARR